MQILIKMNHVKIDNETGEEEEGNSVTYVSDTFGISLEDYTREEQVKILSTGLVELLHNGLEAIQFPYQEPKPEILVKDTSIITKH